MDHDLRQRAGTRADRSLARGCRPRPGEGPQRKHYITNIIIKFGDEGRASVRSDYLVIRESEGGLIPVMGGTYLDTFVKRDGAWQFARKELVHDIAGDMALKNKR
jgi:3-phenylpropionate/cinnamic acid dioxygenase small subunit